MTYSMRSRRFAAFAAVSTLLLAGAGCRQTRESTDAAATPAAASTTAPATPEARKAAHQPYTTPPTVRKNLYPPVDQAQADIAAAEKTAAAEHKRVLLDFGGDWCGDCQVLDIYFHQEPNASLLAKNFVKVNVNIGHEDANLDLAHRYGVPVTGVPALAVVSPAGKVLYAQTQGFEDARYMAPQFVTDFLNKWKPEA